MTALTEWLAAQKALVEKATKGPWTFDETNSGMTFRNGYGILREGMFGESGVFIETYAENERRGRNPEATAAFIADVRTSHPTALRLVEVLMEANEQSRKYLDSYLRNKFAGLTADGTLYVVACAIDECERIVGAERPKEANGE